MAKLTLSEQMQAQTEEARSLLRTHREYESRAVIAEKAGVNAHWLEKFDQEVIKSPRDFGKVESLLRYLRPAVRKAA